MIAQAYHKALGLRPEDTFSAEMLSRALQDTFAPADGSSSGGGFGASAGAIPVNTTVDTSTSLGLSQSQDMEFAPSGAGSSINMSRTVDASTDDDMML